MNEQHNIPGYFFTRYPLYVDLLEVRTCSFAYYTSEQHPESNYYSTDGGARLSYRIVYGGCWIETDSEPRIQDVISGPAGANAGEYNYDIGEYRTAICYDTSRRDYTGTTYWGVECDNRPTEESITDTSGRGYMVWGHSGLVLGLGKIQIEVFSGGTVSGSCRKKFTFICPAIGENGSAIFDNSNAIVDWAMRDVSLVFSVKKILTLPSTLTYQEYTHRPAYSEPDFNGERHIMPAPDDVLNEDGTFSALDRAYFKLAKVENI